MINWFFLTFNAIWILACGIVLATLSYAVWVTSMQHEKLRNIMALTTYQISLYVAGFLFCLGLAGTSHQWWQIVIWLIIVVLFTIQVTRKIIKNKIN